MLDIDSRPSALIADDDEYFRMALAKILRERFGFAEVIETGSFDEAVDRLGKTKGVSLAVFDLMMPGIDSPAALRNIRESFAVARLVVISASRRRSDVLMSLDAGAHGFVSKSQGVAGLQSALRQILDGTVYVPPTLAELDGAAAPPGPDSPAATSRPDRQPHLTPRQREILGLLVEGKSNKEIARELDLAPGTIKVHLAALFRNLGVANRAAAAATGARVLESS